MPTLSFVRRIAAPPQVVFDLCRSVDAHVEAGATIGARAVAHRTRGLAELGDQTTYSARFFGLRFRLTTRITAFDPPRAFDDEMVSGLFSAFAHRYTMVSEAGGTRLEDRFTFSAPGGPLGRLLEWLLLTRAMTRAQNARLDAIQAMAEGQATTAAGEQG